MALDPGGCSDRLWDSLFWEGGTLLRRGEGLRRRDCTRT